MRWSPTRLLPFLLMAILAVPPGLALSVIESGEPLDPLPERSGRNPSDFEIEVEPVESQRRYEPGVDWTVASGHGTQFACPGGTPDNLSGYGSTNVVVIRARCPFRIIDEADLLGSPQIAVRHDDPREMAFFSAHGGATADGPTPRSRDPDPEAPLTQYSHTTFTSFDGGWSWNDNPHGNEGFGEGGDGVISRDGNLFIASLYARPLGVDDDGVRLFDYHFVLYKENDVRSGISYKGHTIPSREPGNTIEEVSLVVVTPPKLIETQEEYDSYMENRTEEDNGTQAPSDDSDVGNHTIPQMAEDYSNDIIAAVWHEKAYDWRNATTGKSSWIDVAWTDASSRDAWHHMPDKQLIGPCRDASNAVAWNGRVYVACVVDAGYTARRGAVIGETDIWQFDLKAEKKILLGTVPGLQDGRPRLAANDEGRFAITSTKPIGDEAPYDVVRLEYVFGWYGRQWGGGGDNIFNIGPQLHGLWNEPVVDARVSNMVLLEDSDLLYMSYSERSASGLDDPEVSPNDPNAGSPLEYHKLVAVIEPCVAIPHTVMDLNVGVARHPFEEGIVNEATGAFDDLHDGMAVAREGGHPAGKEQVYFAYGDHGVIQFGILDAGVTTNQFCEAAPMPPVFFTPVPPVAAPLLVSTGASVATGAAFAAPAALAMGSLLIAKRKTAMAAAVKARK